MRGLVIKNLAVIILVLSLILIGKEVYSLTYQVKTQRVSVTTSATELPTTPLVGRTYISVQNTSDTFVYIGSTDVSDTIGYVLLPYSSWKRDYDHTVDVYGRAGGTAIVRIEEGK